MLHETFNHAEAGLWWSFALGFLVAACRKSSRKRRVQLVLAAAFAGFGWSDWIEVRTGAWWDPWWLLVLKGVCLVTILWGARALYRARRA